jgi:hypothetical protein
VSVVDFVVLEAWLALSVVLRSSPWEARRRVRVLGAPEADDHGIIAPFIPKTSRTAPSEFNITV